MLVKIGNICLLHSLRGGPHLFLMPNDADPLCEFLRTNVYLATFIILNERSWWAIRPPVWLLLLLPPHANKWQTPCHMFFIWTLWRERGEERERTEIEREREEERTREREREHRDRERGRKRENRDRERERERGGGRWGGLVANGIWRIKNGQLQGRGECRRWRPFGFPPQKTQHRAPIQIWQII